MKKTKRIIASLLTVCIIAVSVSGIVSARTLHDYDYMINGHWGTDTLDVAKQSDDIKGINYLLRTYYSETLGTNSVNFKMYEYTSSSKSGVYTLQDDTADHKIVYFLNTGIKGHTYHLSLWLPEWWFSHLEISGSWSPDVN